MKYVVCLILVFLAHLIGFSQTSSIDVINGLKQRQIALEMSKVKQVPFENIGPTIMSGRVVDLAVNPGNPTEFYVAYATGGVWHTVNNGTTFSSIMDSVLTQNVASIAMHWSSRTLWVGTGENNSSRSSYAGIGLLKTEDNGKTWQHVGLQDGHHTSCILINPTNPNEVVVGVTGHLFTPNKNRGIYKTTDGGASWTQQLYIDSVTGIIDLQVSPEDYQVMYASSWTKQRQAWNFKGHGKNSSIYKSKDAGVTWEKISVEQSGFPVGDSIGRIGLAVYNNEVVYAVLDNQYMRPKENEEKEELTEGKIRLMSQADFLAVSDKDLSKYIKSQSFHDKYTATMVKDLVRDSIISVLDVANYSKDPNKESFETEVIGTEVYRSSDGGITWERTHDGYLDKVYNSYGYYFGHIHVSPKNKETIYIYGVPLLASKNGGKSFEPIDAENMHVDHHALWINPNNPKHLINGNDGGVNISYDNGENWIKNNSISVGQFYAINVDNASPYNVYGGLQDNGTWVAPNNAQIDKSWKQRGQYPWKELMGGDGMQVQIDNRNTNIVYVGYQYGQYYRVDRSTNDYTYLKVRHELGEDPYRFNWQSPILLSSFNQDIVYLGGNKMMRSMDKGERWEAISDDLTKGGRKGNVSFGTLTTIAESPFKFGLLYTGSDDGLIHVYQKGEWKNISKELPQDLWVTRLVASKHKEERVYTALSGRYQDDFSVYLYVSEDNGATWSAISGNLPLSPVNVIREDPENEDVLYVGTDNGAYVSFNRGKSWEAFANGLTSVAVHDMVIQPREKDLLLATHGRGVYKASISHLQHINEDFWRDEFHVFDIDTITHSSRWGKVFAWRDTIQPTLDIVFIANDARTQDIIVLNDDGQQVNSLEFTSVKGMNYVSYDLSYSEEYIKFYNKKNKKYPLETVDDGKIYLSKGSYWVVIGNEKVSLVVK